MINFDLNSVNVSNNIEKQPEAKDNSINFLLDEQKDEFEIQAGNKFENEKVSTSNNSEEFDNPPDDKAHNGEFDVSEAAKNFGKGIINPVMTAIKHPVISAFVIAGTIGACVLVPVLTPVLTAGFLGVSAVQTVKGCYNAAQNIKNGKNDEAEKSFETIGEGTAGTLLGAFGVKSAAIAVKEAETLQKLNAVSLNKTQRNSIAMEIENNSFIKNLKETFSIITAKEGRDALISAIKPSSISQRCNDMKNTAAFLKKIKRDSVFMKFKGNEDTLYIHQEAFKKMPEGIRRANMTDEQITQEVQSLYNKVFDELNVPVEQRPKLKIMDKSMFDIPKNNGTSGEEYTTSALGGAYIKDEHTIYFNPQAYKDGIFDMENIIMHEATHCAEALKRAGIPQNKADEIVKKELLSRIKNGESEQIFVSETVLGNGGKGAITMQPPKMSNEMKNDFAIFAQNTLYTKSKELNSALENYLNCVIELDNSSGKYIQTQKMLEPVINELKTIMKYHPEFTKQYTSEEEAMGNLLIYSYAHNNRYNFFTNNKISNVKELTGEALEEAEKSLINHITTTEGNVARDFGITDAKTRYNQYQFSPEEVLAETNGHKFLIKNLNAKLEEMQANGTLSVEDAEYLKLKIKQSEMAINYKTTGLEYQEKYTKMINNPEDKLLQDEVKRLEKLLNSPDLNYHDKVFEILYKSIKMPDRLSFSIPSNSIYELLNNLKANDAKEK